MRHEFAGLRSFLQRKGEKEIRGYTHSGECEMRRLLTSAGSGPGPCFFSLVLL